MDTTARVYAHRVVVVILDGKPDDDNTAEFAAAVASLHSQATVAAIAYSDGNDNNVRGCVGCGLNGVFFGCVGLGWVRDTGAVARIVHVSHYAAST